MVDVIVDGEVAYCLPDCTCCTACHKLIDEVDECPFPEPKGLWSDKYMCTPDCEYYKEIWDENEPTPARNSASLTRGARRP